MKSKELEKYILENQHLLKEAPFIPIIAYGWVGNMIVQTTNLLFGGAIIAKAIEVSIDPVTNWANNGYNRRFARINGAIPQGKFKKEAYLLNRNMTAPEEYWSGWGDALNPFKQRMTPLQIKMFELDHPYIYYDKKREKYVVHNGFAQIYKRAERALKEYQNLKDNRKVNPLFKMTRWNPTGEYIIDVLNRDYPDGFDGAESILTDHGYAGLNRFRKENPWLWHEDDWTLNDGTRKKGVGWYCTTRFPWRWYNTDRSQDSISHDLLVAKFFQNMENKEKFYKDLMLHGDRQLPRSMTDAKTNKELNRAYLAYIQSKDEYAKEIANNVLMSSYNEPQFARHLSQIANRGANYWVRFSPKSELDALDKEDAAREKRQRLAIKARDLKKHPDLVEFERQFQKLGAEGNDNTKKVVNKIKSDVLKKKKTAEKNNYRYELENIEDEIKKLEDFIKEIPSILEKFQRIENGEPIERTEKESFGMTDPEVPASVSAVNEQDGNQNQNKSEKKPKVSGKIQAVMPVDKDYPKPPKGFTDLGLGFNNGIAIRVVQFKETALMYRAKANPGEFDATVGVWNLKGQPVGYVSMGSVHLHPIEGIGMPEDPIKLEDNFKMSPAYKKGAKLKMPKVHKDHEAEEDWQAKSAPRFDIKPPHPRAEHEVAAGASDEPFVLIHSGKTPEFKAFPKRQPNKKFTYDYQVLSNKELTVIKFTTKNSFSSKAGILYSKDNGAPIGFITGDNHVHIHSPMNGFPQVDERGKRFIASLPVSDTEKKPEASGKPQSDPQTPETPKKPTETPQDDQKTEEAEATKRLEQAEAGKKLPFETNNKTMARIQKRLLRDPKLREDKLTLAKIQGNLINYFEPDPREKKTFKKSSTAKKYFRELDSETVQEQKIPSFQVLGDGNYGDETKEAIKAFQRDMIKKKLLAPLKSSTKRKGFSNIDGLYGPNTHNNQYLNAMRQGKLRKKPIVKKKETPPPIPVKPGTPRADKLIKKAKKADKKRGTKINCGEFKKISFERWMAIMVARGCIAYDREYGENYIPAEMKDKCRLCTDKMRPKASKKTNQKDATISKNVFKVEGYKSVDKNKQFPIFGTDKEGRQVGRAKSFLVTAYKKNETNSILGADIIYVPTSLPGTQGEIELSSLEQITGQKATTGKIMPIYNSDGVGIGWFYEGKPYFKKKSEKRPQKVIIMKNESPSVSESIFNAYFSSNSLLSEQYDDDLREIHLSNFIRQCCEAMSIQY